MSWNKIGGEGATIIADALVNNGSLKTVCLDRNNIGNVSAKSLDAYLLMNKSLHAIYLSYNNLSDKGAEKLEGVIGSICNIKELYFDDKQISKGVQDNIGDP